MDEITPTITPQMNQRLIMLATEDEVRQTLFIIHLEKAFGPDGMTSSIFQTLMAYNREEKYLEWNIAGIISRTTQLVCFHLLYV